MENRDKKSDTKQRFLELLEHTDLSIYSIDHDTNYSNTEPDWWVDMLDLQRKIIELRKKYQSHDS